MKDIQDIKALNAKQLWHPMGHPGDLQSNAPTIIDRAEGVRIFDIDGHETIDAVGGLWCANLGYSNDVVKQAISDQLFKLPYYSAFAGTSNAPAIEAAERVIDFFKPDGMERAFFTSGGSDSVETAMRMARQYHRLRGQPHRIKYLSLKKGYHGTHFGGASVNGNPRFRTAYEPLLPGCFHLPSPYTYRNPFNESDPAKLAQMVAQAMEDEIIFQDPSTVAAFIMEPIQGAGGVIVPDASFMKLARNICDKHGILMIADEVITGFGRSGDWSGSRHWGVQPDMMTVAKGITSAYFPVGATLVSAKVAEAFESDQSGEGSIYHGYTYSAHPVGMAAVNACISETVRLDLKTNAAARGSQLFDGLKVLQADFDIIGDVRGGHGLMSAVELVSDRVTKAPMEISSVKRVHKATYEAGTMVRVGGNNLLMSPPLTLTETDVQKILADLRTGLASI
ncbi:MAG: aminotransferase class III-fold pyridoxal phosphate-dependent enzyme, partial [Planktomarina sp.]|nr:aminotransferase class III-fold pyridoxal phosphate-dependent enzyme [Planktomarina sp.]|tara:strand:- start:923 stop:2275 length:1353 start_codon:yes stop_codon:yes gene_type:complete